MNSTPKALTRAAAPLLLGLSLSLAAAAAQAGVLDTLFGGASRSETAKAPPGKRLWVVRENSEVRIVASEEGAKPNQHPAEINPEVLRQQLVQVRFAAGNSTLPLFTSDEVAELVEPIAQALAGAGPAEDLLLLSSARRPDAVMFRPVAVTARVFVQSGSLQLIVHDARYEFYDQMRGTNRPPEFTYGSRMRAGSASLRASAATSVRSDWLAIPLTMAASSAAAPATTSAPAAAPPMAAPPAAAAPAPRPRDAAFGEEAEQRLVTLKRLREKGLISEEEYQQKRREILQAL